MTQNMVTRTIMRAIVFFAFRHGFHLDFYTTTIWVLHLAVCDLLFCLFSAPHYFIVYLGFRYDQAPGMDIVCSASIVLAYLTVYNDWLLLSVIAMTRALNLIYPMEWGQFCGNKWCVGALMTSTWILQFIIILPLFLEVRCLIHTYTML